MGAYYRALGDAAKSKSAPVAWCSSVGPAELLRALGFVVHFPENHSAMIGAARKADRYLPVAHAQGYSQDICSYLTSDIGAYLAGESPLQAFGLERRPARGRARVQYQPVPRRARLVRVVRTPVERAGRRHQLAALGGRPGRGRGR